MFISVFGRGKIRMTAGGENPPLLTDISRPGSHEGRKETNMKKLAVNKSKVDSTIRDLTKRMYEINLFVNIQTKPHKDSDKVWIIVG